MNKSLKFDNILNEMEAEVANMKSLNEIFSKVERLAKEYETDTAALRANNEKLEVIAKEHRAFQEGITEVLENMASQSQEQQEAFTSLFSEKMGILQHDLTSKIKSFEKSLMDTVEELSRSNKQFYKDFEDTVRIKLSEIKMLIEGELGKLTVALQANNGKLEVIAKEYHAFQEGITEVLENMASQSQEQQEAFTSLFSEKMGILQQDLASKIKSFEKSLMDTVEELSRSNKQFYKDFEDTVRIKLSENKSEIKMLIEGELGKLKEALSTEFERRTTTIQQQHEHITKGQNTLRLILLVASGIIAGGLSLVIYFLLKLKT